MKSKTTVWLVKNEKNIFSNFVSYKSVKISRFVNSRSLKSFIFQILFVLQFHCFLLSCAWKFKFGTHNKLQK